MHLAYREDEAQVLREYGEVAARHGEPIELLDPSAVPRRRRPSVRQEGLLLALYSPTEICVDAREVVADLTRFLKTIGVEFRFDDPVADVRTNVVTSRSGRIEAGRVWVCSGDEMRCLFPDLLRQSGLVRCKLQMMRSQPFGDDWTLGPMLAGGLTLRHYPAFRNCPSLASLKDRVARETPWLDRLGIHVMVSQNRRGELVIGDSHEYGAEIRPFDKAEIDAAILDYLETFLDAPPIRIDARWHGTYAKHPDRPYVILSPCPEVTIVTGVGGAGMTLSFGRGREVVVEQVLGPGALEVAVRSTDRKESIQDDRFKIQ